MASHAWECVSADVPWAPRDGAQLVSLHGKLYLLGGWNQQADDPSVLLLLGSPVLVPQKTRTSEKCILIAKNGRTGRPN